MDKEFSQRENWVCYVVKDTICRTSKIKNFKDYTKSI